MELLSRRVFGRTAAGGIPGRVSSSNLNNILGEICHKTLVRNLRRTPWEIFGWTPGQISDGTRINIKKKPRS